MKARRFAKWAMYAAGFGAVFVAGSFGWRYLGSRAQDGDVAPPAFYRLPEEAVPEIQPEAAETMPEVAGTEGTPYKADQQSQPGRLSAKLEMLELKVGSFLVDIDGDGVQELLEIQNNPYGPQKQCNIYKLTGDGYTHFTSCIVEIPKE